MRSFTFEHNGKEHTLVATFEAAEEIAQKVADPLFMAREAAIEAQMASSGLVYQPKFAFSVSNLPVIIGAGLKAAGSQVTRDDLKAMIFDMGLIEAKDLASLYLAMIATPKSERPVKADAGDAAPGE